MNESSSSIFGDFSMRDYIAILVVSVLTFAVYSNSLKAALDVRQDDHRIIFFSDSTRVVHHQIAKAHDETGNAIQPTLAWYLASDAGVGRFRPLTQTLEVLLPRVLGTDSARWHLLVLLLASLTAAALFLIGRCFGGSWIEGTALALLVVLAPDPGPARVWYMMSVKAEAFGTLFVLFAVLASLRAAHPTSRLRDEVPPVILIALAMLTKEPFALLLPALLMVRLGLPSWLGYVSRWRDTPRVKQVVAIYLSLGASYTLAIGMMIAAAPPNSYGTESLHEWSMLGKGLRSTLGHVPQQAAWFVPVLLAGIAVFLARGFRGVFRTFSVPFALTACWVTPQILLYSLRGGMWDHYWLPCLLGFAGLNVWSLRLLRLERPQAKVAFALSLFMFVVYSANGVRTNVPTVANYVQRTLMQDDAVNALVQGVPPNGKVVIVADNAFHSEYAFSWLFFTGKESQPDTTYLLYDVTRPNSATFAKSTYFPYATPHDQVYSCDVDAIVFLDQPADTDLAWNKWYKKECFRTESFVRRQEYISLRRLGFVSEQIQLELVFKKGPR